MKEHFGILLRGIAMGAADVVPGVSGGTIAFITGIYQRLLNSISAFDLTLIATFRNGGIRAVWKQVDGGFIAYLLSGIGISVVVLSRFIHSALEIYPTVVWAFFFGLVLASVPFMWRQINQPNIKAVLLLAGGAILAFGVTSAKPMTLGDDTWLIFVCASLAICATILPGISGSFILLILGIYPIVIEAIGYGDFRVITSFAAGAVFGLLTFAKAVAYVYRNYTDEVLAGLTGFLLGSLNTLWPWKVAIESVVKSSGEVVPLVQQKVMPDSYTVITQNESYWVMAMIAFMIGFGLVSILEKLGSKKTIE